MKVRYVLILLSTLTSFMLNSCFKDMGRKMAAGAREELNKSQFDSLSSVISKSAAKGILEVALNDSVQRRIRMQLDSVGRTLDRQAVTTATHLRDSVLLGKYTELWVQNVINAAGESLQNRGNGFLDNIRGEQTLLFAAKLRDELLNDVTLQRAAVFRDELLGTNTHVLMDSLAQKVARGLFNNQINPSSQKLIADINKVANEKIRDAKRLAYIAGMVALLIGGVAFFVYRQARRHKETLKIVTKQIDKIPDQPAYDQLVNAIRKETEAKGLEPHLQTILKEEKLYQQEEWQKKDYQLLNLVTKYLHDLHEEKPGSEILQDLSAKAREVHLDSQLKSLLARSRPNGVYQQT